MEVCGFDFFVVVVKNKHLGSIYPRKYTYSYDVIESSRSQFSDEDVMINKTLLMAPESKPH